MAEGIFQLDSQTIGVNLLSGSVVNGSSEWYDMRRYSHQMVRIAPMAETGGKVEIMASNDESKPASGVDGSIVVTLAPNAQAPAGSANGAVSGLGTLAPFCWVKAKRTIGASPVPVNITLNGAISGG